MPRKLNRNERRSGRRKSFSAAMATVAPYFKSRRASRSRPRGVLGGSRNVMINRGPSAIPPTFLTRFRTVSNLSETSGAGTVASHTFKINSCFDPLGDTSGGQPSGWDQIAGVMYNNYMVLFSVSNVEIMNTGASTILWAAYISDSDSPVATLTQAMEIPYAKSGLLGVSGSGNNRTRFKFAVKPTTILGRNKPINDQMANVTSDPADLVNLHLLWQDTGASAAATLFTRYISTQYTRLSDRIDLPLS